jgi:RNA polymerase sigma-70 factor (ECF subfamily)
MIGRHTSAPHDRERTIGDRSVETPTPSGVVSAEARENRLHGVPLRLEGSSERDRAAVAQRMSAALRNEHALVWRVLRRLGVDSASLDDAVQHVFLTLSARLAEIEPGRERRFLLGACPGVAANARRRSDRLRDDLTGEEMADLDGLTPEQLLDWKQRRQALDAALETFSIEQRTVFVLFELEGLSLPEIAESLGVPLGTATSRLRRAREAFAAWVRRRNEKGGQR